MRVGPTQGADKLELLSRKFLRMGSQRPQRSIAALSNEGGPIVGVWLGLTQRAHGLTQAGGPALTYQQVAIVGLHELGGGVVAHLPEAYNHRLGASDDEGPAEPIDALAQFDVATTGVAGG